MHRGNYEGILLAAFYVRHRVTKEIRIVELGARYNQVDWELLYEVPTDISL